MFYSIYGNQQIVVIMLQIKAHVELSQRISSGGGEGGGVT